MLKSEALLLERRKEEALEEARREVLVFSSQNSHEDAQRVKGGKKRACAVVIQALFELGRGEEAEEFTLQCFCPREAPKCFGNVPPVLVEVIYKLRKFLDQGKTEGAGRILTSFFDTYSAAEDGQEDADVTSRLAQAYLLQVLAKEQGKEVCRSHLPRVEAFLSERAKRRIQRALEEEVDLSPRACSTAQKVSKEKENPPSHRRIEESGSEPEAPVPHDAPKKRDGSDSADNNVSDSFPHQRPAEQTARSARKPRADEVVVQSDVEGYTAFVGPGILDLHHPVRKLVLPPPLRLIPPRCARRKPQVVRRIREVLEKNGRLWTPLAAVFSFFFFFIFAL
eukprot:383004-Hanusia_phi.AAC.5